MTSRERASRTPSSPSGGAELTLDEVVRDIADALVAIDSSRVPFKTYQPGVGPYGEPQLLGAVVKYLGASAPYQGRIAVRRTPDVLIKDAWAIECKLARPFGDDGRPAENWSINLLHPYPGNTSSLGDCLKLRSFVGPERRAVLAVGYEHTPPQTDLETLFRAFEILAEQIVQVHIGPRVEAGRRDLVHPVHQQLRVCAWEILRENLVGGPT